MTKMSTLPRDLAEEILSKVPMTSLRSVRSTCKNWNTLSKDVSFSKKRFGRQAKVAASREKEFLVVMMMEFRVYLMSVNLHNNSVEPYSIMFRGEVISLDDSDQIDVHHVFHCDGLLLCVMKDKTRIVVWNPYIGQTRWIEPVHHTLNRAQIYKYALGYDKSSKICSYKILRFIDFGCPDIAEYQLYYLNSNSWKVLDVTSNKYINTPAYYRGISLRGNTYWFATDLASKARGFLLCFDFTKERFARRLRLPFRYVRRDTVTLSSVREVQLAVLIQRWDTLNMEIWVTSRIEPNAVFWSSKVFLALNMSPLTDVQLSVRGASFFIDQEKKVAVIFDQKTIGSMENYTCNVAYIVGMDGSMEEADLGESAYTHCYHLSALMSQV